MHLLHDPEPLVVPHKDRPVLHSVRIYESQRDWVPYQGANLEEAFRIYHQLKRSLGQDQVLVLYDAETGATYIEGWLEYLRHPRPKV